MWDFLRPCCLSQRQPALSLGAPAHRPTKAPCGHCTQSYCRATAADSQRRNCHFAGGCPPVRHVTGLRGHHLPCASRPPWPAAPLCLHARQAATVTTARLQCDRPEDTPTDGLKDELGVAQWVAKNNRPAGAGTDSLPGSRHCFIPISSRSDVLAVAELAVLPGQLALWLTPPAKTLCLPLPENAHWRWKKNA